MPIPQVLHCGFNPRLPILYCICGWLRAFNESQDGCFAPMVIDVVARPEHGPGPATEEL